MRIIAISDTHIKYGSIMEQLPAGLAAMLKDADMVIHAGDFVIKAAYDELSSICRLVAVQGNMDEAALKSHLSVQSVVEIESIRIGVVHEAALSLQDTTGAGYLAREMGVDVLIFGHLHRPLIEKSDALLICPGSPTAPRLSDPCAVELVIENGRISGNIVKFEGPRCNALESAGSFHK